MSEWLYLSWVLKSVAKVWFVGIGDIYYHSESNPDTINTECRASFLSSKSNGLQFELEHIGAHSVKIEGLRQKKLYNGFYDKYLLSHVWRDDFRCFWNLLPGDFKEIQP